jgi:hypothetical protein
MTIEHRTLLVNGCSHAAGSDIDPLEHEPSGWSPRKAFGGHLATALGWQYENIAMPGGSNERIVRTTVERVGRALSDGSSCRLFVLVMWTGHYRFELYDDRRQCWLNLCPGVEESSYFDGYPFAVQRYFKYHYLVRSTRTETSTRFWLSVLLLQSYLELHGVQYLFCNSYEVLDCDPSFDGYMRQLKHRRFYEPFDKSRSYWWQLKADGYRVNGPPASARPRGFQGHYGEDGHRSWAERLLPIIRSSA